MEGFMTDDVIREGLRQPVMWITRDAADMRREREHSGGWREADIARHQSTMRTAYQQARSAAYFVEIPGMFHIDLTDLNALSPVLPYLGLSGRAGRERTHQLINAYSLAFFDQHLRGSKDALRILSVTQ